MLQQVDSVQSPIVTLFVSSEGVSSERRFNRDITIATLKERLSPITGVPPSTMKISVYGRTAGSTKESMIYVGFYPLEDFMALQVTDSNPTRVKGAFTDTSLVEKYEMPDDEYAKRQDSVLAYKMRHKIGRFDDSKSMDSTRSDDFKTEASRIKPGDRCKVSPASDEDGFSKIGTVKFVGLTKFKPGWWIGVEYDEPVGKHDGTVSGTPYFTCRPKHGVMVRPNRVEVGEFEEEDLFGDDDEI
ncbi:CAP Gly-rich domain-containing protein [Chytridium lagenaria]|nr:CAP Gly-rich domain-containing protein [Chytridium lagenaria]